MRSNRLRGCLVVAALFTGSSASAQETDDKADKKPDDKAAPATVAQAQPEPPPAPPTEGRPDSAGPSTPGARQAPAMTEDDMRKMIEAEVAKTRPKGPAVEFSGYGRAAVGLNIRGGKQVCFGLAGADTKWRLGNECDYVFEPQFTGRLVTLEDKSSWGIVFMPGLYRTYEDPNGPAGSDKTWNDNLPAWFRQFYFFGENVPQLLNGRIWGGKRYYDRLHLDINDQFLEIEDGDGAGVEDMQVGVGKLSVAFLMNPNSEASQLTATSGNKVSTANLAPFKLTARLTDIKTAPEGSLQIWAGLYSGTTSTDQITADGIPSTPKPANIFRLGVYHTLGKILGGTNFVGAKGEFGTNHLVVRAVVQEQMVFNAGHTAVDVIGEFRTARDRPNSDADWVTNHWLSLGARADHQLSGPFRFLFETGIDRVLAASGGDPQLIKATGALAVSAGDGAGSRPSFRLFYTHGFWNDEAKTSALGVYAHGQSGNRLRQVYGDKNNGGSFGIQAEAWW